MASLANWTDSGEGAVEQYTANLSTLDTLLADGRIDRPAFIKCDVEGAETMVFRGGRSLLDRADAPIILYEADTKSAAGFGQHIADATRVLASYSHADYAFYAVPKSGALQRLESPSALSHYTNLLAVPAARRDRTGQLGI